MVPLSAPVPGSIGRTGGAPQLALNEAAADVPQGPWRLSPLLADSSRSSTSSPTGAGFRRALACASAAAAGARTLARRRALSEEATEVVEAPTKQSNEFRKEPKGRLSGAVYLWQTPLVLPPLFPSALATVLPKHSVVLAACEDGGYAAFDFEPVAKEDIGVALQLLAGGSVPGRFGARILRRLPDNAVYLGKASPTATAEDITDGVNLAFPADLSLSSNDCHSYSERVLQAILEDSAKPVGRRLFSTLNLDEVRDSGSLAYKEPSVFNAVVLVAGTTVGAGVLALPAVTQQAGFVPSSVVLFFCWMYMATTGLLIAEVSLSTMASSGASATSLQSMAARTIGPNGALLGSFAFVFLHFALLIAYLSRGGELIASLIPALGAVPVPGPAIFAAIFGGFVFFAKGTDLLDQVNNAFALVVVASFFALVSLAAPEGDPSRLFAVSDWSKGADILPTLLLSLVYHNIVPTICNQLEGDRGKISTAIVGGSFVPFVMFVIWNAAVLAALPDGSPPDMDPLEVLRSSGGSLVGSGVLFFSLSAIVTSFFGFVLALTDFFQDFFRNIGFKDEEASIIPRIRNFSLTLLLPLAVSCLDPSLFFQAIDQAGAFGVSTLFGFLPALMALMQRAQEPRVLAKEPGLRGVYPRGPLVPGGLIVLLLVASVALGVVVDNALELLQ
mmetsp:Transcript_58967/g.140787  ORF Transcript_58967/g.140787 Transcript_58967/m.140787 type:complete len:673 (+) Transcript_58967:64-2082(+)